MVIVFENYFLLPKTRRMRKITRTRLVLIFFVLKNIENIENNKFREQEQFSENTKMTFSVFSKNVVKNSLKKIRTKHDLWYLSIIYQIQISLINL